MNLHTPERQPSESREQYAKRRKASKAYTLGQTHPERFMPISPFRVRQPRSYTRAYR